jgi:hypothetical protein
MNYKLMRMEDCAAFQITMTRKTLMLMRKLALLIITFLAICLAPSVAMADDTPTITEYEREELARMLYGEDRCDDWSVEGVMRKAAVVQVALNRLDAWGEELFGIDDAIVRQSQFHGYDRGNPVKSWAMDIVQRVCDGWEAEQRGEENLWRVLPADYLYFAGNCGVNRFRMRYEPDAGEYWDFENVREDVWNEYLNAREVVDGCE